MYIDPNTGGILFQVLAVVIGIFSGAALLFSSKIKAAFARIQRYSRSEDGRADTPEAIIQQTGVKGARDYPSESPLDAQDQEDVDIADALEQQDDGMHR